MKTKPNIYIECAAPTVALFVQPVIIFATITKGYPGLTRAQSVSQEIRRAGWLLLYAPFSLLVRPWLCPLANWMMPDDSNNQGCGPYNKYRPDAN